MLKYAPHCLPIPARWNMLCQGTPKKHAGIRCVEAGTILLLASSLHDDAALAREMYLVYVTIAHSTTLTFLFRMRRLSQLLSAHV